MKAREALEIAGKKRLIVERRRNHKEQYWEFMYWFGERVFVHDDGRRVPEIKTREVATQMLFRYLVLYDIPFEKVNCTREDAPSVRGLCFEFLVDGKPYTIFRDGIVEEGFLGWRST